jgi:hypothetical protein
MWVFANFAVSYFTKILSMFVGIFKPTYVSTNASPILVLTFCFRLVTPFMVISPFVLEMLVILKHYIILNISII